MYLLLRKFNAFAVSIAACFIAMACFDEIAKLCLSKLLLYVCRLPLAEGGTPDGNTSTVAESDLSYYGRAVKQPNSILTLSVPFYNSKLIIRLWC